MTITEYLQKKRQDNPDFSTLSDFSLYNKLRAEDDPNLPNLQAGGPQRTTIKPRGQKAYERKVNPDTTNAFFDWTDLGINDVSVSVANTTIFGTQEGISTSAGYAQINGEIIYFLFLMLHQYE